MGVYLIKHLFGNKKMGGAAGFEPTTPSPPVKCATRLRYAPTQSGYTRRALPAQFPFHLFPACRGMRQGRACRSRQTRQSSLSLRSDTLYTR